MDPRRIGRGERRQMRAVALASQVGIVLVLATLIGWAVGQWLDTLLGTSPWLMALFTLLGVAAGFVQLFRIVLAIAAEEESGRGRDE